MAALGTALALGAALGTAVALGAALGTAVALGAALGGVCFQGGKTRAVGFVTVAIGAEFSAAEFGRELSFAASLLWDTSSSRGSSSSESCSDVADVDTCV